MGKLFNLLFYFTLSVNLINLCSCEEYRVCGDENCQTAISKATTLQRYRANTKDKLSFEPRQEIYVYSKPQNPKTKEDNLWEVIINGRRGFVPSHLLVEKRLLINPSLLVTVTNKPKKLKISKEKKQEELEGSIPQVTEEATTTAPLQSEPKNLVVSSENSENSSEVLQTLLPVQSKGEVIDGTKLPPQYLQRNVDVKEDEGNTGVEDNLNENLTRNSVVGIFGEKYADKFKYIAPTQSTEKDPSSVLPEVEIDNSLNTTEENSGVENEKADGPLTGTVEGSNNAKIVTVEPKSFESSEQDSNETGAAKQTSESLQEEQSIEEDGVVQKNIKPVEMQQHHNKQAVQVEPEKDSFNIESNEDKDNISNPESKFEYSETLQNITKDDNNTAAETNNAYKNETADNSVITETLDDEKSTDLERKEQQNIETKTSTILDPFLASRVNETFETVNETDKNVENTLVQPKQSIPEPEHEKIDSNSFNSPNKGIGGSQSDEIKESMETQEPVEAHQNITQHEVLNLEDKKKENETNQNELPASESKTNAEVLNLEDQKKESETNQNEMPASESKTNAEQKILEDPSYSGNQREKNEVNPQEPNLPDSKAYTKQEVETPAYVENQNEEIEVNKIEQTLPMSKAGMKSEAGDTQSYLGNTKTDNEINQVDPTLPKSKASTEDVDASAELKFETSNEIDGVETLSQKTQTDDHQEVSPIVNQNINSEAEVPTETENKPNVNSFENSLKGSSVDDDNSSENEVHKATEEFPQVPKNEETHEVSYESVDNKIIDDSENSRNVPGDRLTTETVKNNWFFSNVFETVNNFWSTLSKSEQKDEENFDADLGKILFPNNERSEITGEKGVLQESSSEDGYCEKVTPNNCPAEEKNKHHGVMAPHIHNSNSFHNNMCSSERDFFSSLSDKVLEMVDLLACLLITALTALLFAFGYYCICHSRKESVLLSKLNIVERSLLVSSKEAAILKHDLIETRNKLTSIEDNSFGSNDMVMALKKELQDSEDMKLTLQEQVASLEKELENAAEAGLELNKIVSELLNNQSGDDSIISSVEDLQKQLNEQQNTILQINATLAEKSRENSELQLILTNQATKYQEDIQTLKQQNEDLQSNKIILEAKFEESKHLLQEEMSKAVEEKRLQIQSLNKELSALREKCDDIYRKLQMRDARVQVLEECLNGVKNNAKFNIKDIFDAVNLKTEVLAIKRERDSLKERLEGETDARKLLDDHIKVISEEVSNLKQEYNQSEKEKLEAKTRLEVLSSYFKEKETQLQKELSLKEAMWLKQQGETSSTVERVRLMQDEIQALKSQNDSLRAEIEAQAATHKAQITNLENRGHETWLAARQSERKLEEARIEATALRRKLTSIAGNPLINEANSQTRLQNSVDGLSNDVNNAPSPVHMDSPSAPLIGGLPPPLPFLPPPPFMAHPHQFMPIPPPFMPPGEMRPPPLGRLMSPPPPPPPDRYSPTTVDERDRYSPPNGRYSPHSRYNYNTDIMSNYDTETDFSPPPSPGTRSGGGNGGGAGGGGGYSSRERRDRNRFYNSFSPPPTNNSDRNKKSKGILSSGSAESYDSRKSRGKGKV